MSDESTLEKGTHGLLGGGGGGLITHHSRCVCVCGGGIINHPSACVGGGEGVH